MKIPCEVIAKDVLPMIRRELSVLLVRVHGISQADVARRLDLTDAAISQYIRDKRGVLPYKDFKSYKGFSEELEKSAQIVADGGDTTAQLCRLCNVVKESGLLAEIYRKQAGTYPKCCTGNNDQM